MYSHKLNLEREWLGDLLRGGEAELVLADILVDFVLLEPGVDNVESGVVDRLICVLLKLFNLVNHVRLLNLQRQILGATGRIGHVEQVGDAIENDLNKFVKTQITLKFTKSKTST